MLRWWYDHRVHQNLKLRAEDSVTSNRPLKIKWSRVSEHRAATDTPLFQQPTSRQEENSVYKQLIQSLLDLFRRDFILAWYKRISPSSAFPQVLETTLKSCIDSLETRLSTVDIPQLLISKILPHMTSHLQAYAQVEALLFRSTVQTTANSDGTSQATLDPAPILQTHYKSPLHPALPAPALTNPMPSVEAHVRDKIQSMLKLLLPPAEVESKTVSIIAREVLTCVVGMPLVEMLSDPDFWNRMLDEQADKRLQER